MSIHCPIEDLANSYHHLPSDLWAFPQPISLFDNQPKFTCLSLLLCGILWLCPLAWFHRAWGGYEDRGLNCMNKEHVRIRRQAWPFPVAFVTVRLGVFCALGLQWSWRRIIRHPHHPFHHRNHLASEAVPSYLAVEFLPTCLHVMLLPAHPAASLFPVLPPNLRSKARYCSVYC